MNLLRIRSTWVMLSCSLALFVQANPAWHYEERTALPLPSVSRAVTGGHSILPRPEGGAYLFGPFTHVNRTPASRLVRLHQNGTLDDAFSVDDSMLPLFLAEFALDASGRIYLPGAGSRQLIRLGASGAVDPGYALEATVVIGGETYGGYILGTHSSADGGIMVYGNFTHLDGTAAAGLARLTSEGMIDAGFHAAAMVSVQQAPLRDSVGRWIVVDYPAIADLDPSLVAEWPPGSAPVRIRRLQPAGGLDPAFQPQLFPMRTAPGPHAFALDRSDRVVFADSIDPARPELGLRLVRLRADGSPDPEFAPELPTIVHGIPPYVHGGAGSGDSAEGRISIWIPPFLNQIVAHETEELLCVANWFEASYGGVVRVSGAGAVSTSPLFSRPARTVRSFVRGPMHWWGEIMTDGEARPVRFLADGLLDDTFEVHTSHAATVHGVNVLSTGAMVLSGDFDDVAGAASGGVAIITPDGSVNPLAGLAGLGGRGFGVRAVLSDDSLLLVAAMPGYVLLRLDGELTSLPLQPLVRVRSSGEAQVLQVPGNSSIMPRHAWLAADGALLVVAPPSRHVAGLGTDILRFQPDGTFDPTWIARDHSGASLSVTAAAPMADGGIAVLSNDGLSARLHLLDTSGASSADRQLQLTRADGYLAYTNAVAALLNRIAVGGRFDAAESTWSPGLALYSSNPTGSPLPGRWLHAGSAVTELQTLGLGLLWVSGPELRTPRGRAAAVVLRPDGLPDVNVPFLPKGSDNMAAVSPDGRWLIHHTPAESRVRRWEAVPRGALGISAPVDAVPPGTPVILAVTSPAGSGPIQWWRSGEPVTTDGRSRLEFVAQAQDDGSIWQATTELAGTRWSSDPVVLRVREGGTRMINGSVRGLAGVGEQSLIAGAIVFDPERSGVLVRGLGAALKELGIEHAAPGVRVVLLDERGEAVSVPEPYRIARDLLGGNHPDVVAAALRYGAYFPQAHPLTGNDQMLYLALDGRNLHLHVQPGPGMTGVALAEWFLYESPIAPPRAPAGFRNLSGRALVEQGDRVLVGGFVLEGTEPRRVLVRGLGPRLEDFGLSASLPDPVLRLYGGSQLLAENDNWSTSNADELAEAARQVGAVSLPLGSADAALLYTLAPGAYTAIVSPAASSAFGVALVEVFLLD